MKEISSEATSSTQNGVMEGETFGNTHRAEIVRLMLQTLQALGYRYVIMLSSKLLDICFLNVQHAWKFPNPSSITNFPCAGIPFDGEWKWRKMHLLLKVSRNLHLQVIGKSVFSIRGPCSSNWFLSSFLKKIATSLRSVIKIWANWKLMKTFSLSYDTIFFEFVFVLFIEVDTGCKWLTFSGVLHWGYHGEFGVEGGGYGPGGNWCPQFLRNFRNFPQIFAISAF